MTELMRTLYEFALGHGGNASKDPEYKRIVSRITDREEELQRRLGEEGAYILDELLTDVIQQNCMDLEYLFQATFELCRELKVGLWA